MFKEKGNYIHGKANHGLLIIFIISSMSNTTALNAQMHLTLDQATMSLRVMEAIVLIECIESGYLYLVFHVSLWRC